jgi:hypothetical protein
MQIVSLNWAGFRKKHESRGTSDVRKRVKGLREEKRREEAAYRRKCGERESNNKSGREIE